MADMKLQAHPAISRPDGPVMVRRRHRCIFFQLGAAVDGNISVSSRNSDVGRASALCVVHRG